MTGGKALSPALRGLREATAVLHNELDALSPLASPQLDRARYLSHAERARPWFYALEQILADAEWGEWPLPMQAQPRFEKARWIEQDLLAGGRPVSVLQGAPSSELPRPYSLAAAFGMAYVTEGSTLGGAVLFRRLASRLAPLPLRWQWGYGAATGDMWRQFLELLALHVTGHHAIAEAAAAARHTFRSYRRCVIEGAPALAVERPAEMLP